jgi:putative oxidoreductase
MRGAATGASPGSPDRLRHALLAVRLTGAATMVTHGVARIAAGGVAPFGGFLASQGFPAGAALAWSITFVEIAGGLALASGYAVRPLALWFAMQLVAGIALVHARHGWFTVGLGRNGMEYSVVLIVIFLATAWAAPSRSR